MQTRMVHEHVRKYETQQYIRNRSMELGKRKITQKQTHSDTNQMHLTRHTIYRAFQ